MGIPKAENSYLSMALVGISEEEFQKHLKTTSLWKIFLREISPIQNVYAEECIIPGQPRAESLESISTYYKTNVPRDSFQCVANGLKGAWNSTGGVILDASEGIKNLFKDPKSFWDRRVKEVQNLVGFIYQFDSKIKSASAALNSLPANIKTQLLCGFVGSMGTSVALGVMTGGPALAKALIQMEEFVRKLVQMDKVFMALHKVGKLKYLDMGFYQRFSSARLPLSTLDNLYYYATNGMTEQLLKALRQIF